MTGRTVRWADPAKAARRKTFRRRRGPLAWLEINNIACAIDLRDLGGEQFAQKLATILEQCESASVGTQGSCYFTAYLKDRFHLYVTRTGYVNVTGGREESEIARALSAPLNLSEAEVKRRMVVNSISANGNLNCLPHSARLNFERLREIITGSSFITQVTFDAERFPCLKIKTKQDGTLLIFSTQSLVLVGACNKESLNHVRLWLICIVCRYLR